MEGRRHETLKLKWWQRALNIVCYRGLLIIVAVPFLLTGLVTRGWPGFKDMVDVLRGGWQEENFPG